MSVKKHPRLKRGILQVDIATNYWVILEKPENIQPARWDRWYTNTFGSSPFITTWDVLFRETMQGLMYPHVDYVGERQWPIIPGSPMALYVTHKDEVKVLVGPSAYAPEEKKEFFDRYVSALAQSTNGYAMLTSKGFYPTIPIIKINPGIENA